MWNGYPVHVDDEYLESVPTGFCKGLKVLRAPAGEIRTNGNGDKKPAGIPADCRWVILAPKEGEKLEFWFSKWHLHGEGHVRIYTGVDAERLLTKHMLDSARAFRTFTGLLRPWGSMPIPSSQALVAFESEPRDESVSFVLHWRAVPA